MHSNQIKSKDLSIYTLEKCSFVINGYAPKKWYKTLYIVTNINTYSLPFEFLTHTLSGTVVVHLRLFRST